MHTKTHSLTEGPLGKQILTFSLPLILSNVLQVLFNMADVAVVGRFCGPRELGAVGSTSIMVALFTGILMGMGSAVNVLVAQFVGAKSHKDVEETVHTSAILCLLTGIVILIIGLLFARPLLELLNTKDELIDGATLYLHIYFWGMPAMAIYNFGNGVLSAVGDTKRPLYFLTTAGVINVILNLFFVLVLGMSVDGVAFATIISQYISAILILISLFRSSGIHALHLSALRLTPSKAKRILLLGIPAGMQNAIFQMANLFIQAGVNSFDATMVEGNSAAANSDALVYDVMAAFYTACSSFMGQNFGAGKKDRVIKSFLISLAYSFGIGAIMGCSLVVFGRNFLSIFTTEPEVIEAGMHRLTVMGLSYGISAFMDCPIAACRGLGKSVIPTMIVIMGSCVFRIIWVYTIFAYFHTILSLYLLYVFSWSITAIAELIYFVHIYKQQMAGIRPAIPITEG